MLHGKSAASKEFHRQNAVRAPLSKNRVDPVALSLRNVPQFTSNGDGAGLDPVDDGFIVRQRPPKNDLPNRHSQLRSEDNRKNAPAKRCEHPPTLATPVSEYADKADETENQQPG